MFFRLALTLVLGLLYQPLCYSQSAVEVTTFPTQGRPVYLTHAPDDSERVFVVGQGFESGNARIRIIDLMSGELSDPFFSVSEVVCCTEAGLLGLAFHPDYQSNGLFYVSLVTESVKTPFQLQIWEYSRLTDDVADQSSGRMLLAIDKTSSQHNGGWLGFSPIDGYLYITVGDSQFATNAQDLNSLNGKILRIDPRGNNSANGQYGIPATNPFVGEDGSDEIWAYGLRNPWRASFDRETGDFYFGDVGSVFREEVNVQAASSTGGENYGWSLREGANGFQLDGAVDPIYDYSHGFAKSQGRCVIGGYVYRGPIASLRGRYFFGDNRSMRLWSINWDQSDPQTNDGTNFTNFQDWTNLLTENVDPPRISSFGEDAEGNLYILNHVPTAGDNLIRIDSVFILGDVNCDGTLDVLDVQPFANAIFQDEYLPKADINGDGALDLLDVQPFVELLTVN